MALPASISPTGGSGFRSLAHCWSISQLVHRETVGLWCLENRASCLHVRLFEDPLLSEHGMEACSAVPALGFGQWEANWKLPCDRIIGPYPGQWLGSDGGILELHRLWPSCSGSKARLLWCRTLWSIINAKLRERPASRRKSPNYLWSNSLLILESLKNCSFALRANGFSCDRYLVCLYFPKLSA